MGDFVIGRGQIFDISYRTVVTFLESGTFLDFRKQVTRFPAKVPSVNTSFSVHRTAICNQSARVHQVTAGIQSSDPEGSQVSHVYL